MAYPVVSAKLEIPQEWLQHLELDCDTSELLTFDSTLICKLNQLASRNKLADSEASNIIEILKDIKNEYIMSGQQMKNLLKSLRLTPEQMSTNTRKCLKELSQSNYLETFDESASNKVIYDTYMAVETAKLAVQVSAIKRQITSVTESNTNMLGKIAEFQQELVLVKEEYNTLKSNSEEKVCAAKICDAKAKKLEHMLKDLKVEMTKNGVPDQRKYKMVLENHEELKVMKVELTKLQSEIQKYDQLPPDLDEAKKALLLVKQEHEQLVKQINSKIHSTTTLM